MLLLHLLLLALDACYASPVDLFSHDTPEPYNELLGSSFPYPGCTGPAMYETNIADVDDVAGAEQQNAHPRADS